MVIEESFPSNHSFTLLLPTPMSLSNHTPTEQNQKRKREMCEPQITFPPQSPIQLQPTTPPRILQRMKTDTCFNCKQQGHWRENCPFKSQNNSNNNSYKSLSSSVPVKIPCRCGHGLCDVIISHTAENPNRPFFVCPIKRGAPCKDFVKWCDKIEENDFQLPLLKYPMCECGAGVCKKRKEKHGFCFVCPIKKDHGSCGFRVSEEELLNNRSIVPFQKTRQRTLREIWEGSQNDKKMRINDNPENPSPVAVSDIPDGESPIQEANSQHIDFPVLELDNDDMDLDSVPWDVIEASVSSRLSTPSSIRHRQSLFQSDIGIFPSFDAIIVPEQAGTPNSDQFSTITHVEASKDLISPNKSPISKAPIHSEVALFTQKRLLNDLENFDPHQHESMRETTTTTFELLNRLGFECKQFSDLIWDFINLVSSMAEIDKSMENSPTLEEHNKFLEEEKAKFAHIQDDYIKTKALFGAFNQQRKTLSEEVHRIEAMLCEKQKDLKSCELETVKIETRLCDLKRNMLDAETTLKDRGRQAEVAREKSVDRRRKEIAAKIALEMVKWELEN